MRWKVEGGRWKGGGKGRDGDGRMDVWMDGEEAEGTGGKTEGNKR